jgi:hypothetical protein
MAIKAGNWYLCDTKEHCKDPRHAQQLLSKLWQAKGGQPSLELVFQPRMNQTVPQLSMEPTQMDE